MASYDDSGDLLDPPGTATQLLVPNNRQELAPLSNWPPLSSPGSESLTSSPTLSQLLHCFRRRWPLAIGLSLLLSGLLASAVYFLVPISYESAALLRVNRTIEGGTTLDPDTYNTYRKTQAQLVKSNNVLSDALGSDEIRNLRTIQEWAPQPSKSLERALKVDYPGDAELMQILLRGDEPAELPKIVNAVKDAYLRLIVNKERDEKIDRREKISRELKNRDGELVRKEKALHDLVEGVGGGDSKQIDTQRSVLIAYLAVLRQKIGEADSMMLQKELDLQAVRARSENNKNPAAEIEIPAMIIERAINEDSEVRTAKGRRDAEVERIALIKSKDVRGDRSPDVVEAKQKIQGYDQQIEDRTRDIRPQIIAEVKRTIIGNKGPLLEQSPEQNIKLLDSQMQRISDYLSKLRQEYDTKLEEAKKLGSTVLNLEQQRTEIDNLKQFRQSLNKEVFNLDVELRTSVSRVVQIEDAKVPDGDNRLYRGLLIAFASLGGVGLATIGVVFAEFQSRRINSASEVNQGLALRVLGTLPNRRGASSTEVGESIDNIRTMLLKGGGLDTPHMVMVTSAQVREGKTTVASQLAASLARSGRKTLLIDGDLRKPIIHKQFAVPLENGFCEVLRRQVDMDDAVQASMIADLWIMPAGVVDQAAIIALSRDSIQELFRRLRAKYDFIVIDSGPVLAFADSLMLGHFVDAAVISVRRDRSQLTKVHEARERLEAVGIRVLGAVVNGVRVKIPRGFKSLPSPK